jgi:hypothetical protein
MAGSPRTGVAPMLRQGAPDITVDPGADGGSVAAVAA